MPSVKGFKHVGFLTRKKGQSFEDFVKHWEEVHTAITLKLPGLRGYVLNPIDREKYRTHQLMVSPSSGLTPLKTLLRLLIHPSVKQHTKMSPIS